MTDAIIALASTLVLLTIVWGPILLILWLAKRFSNSRKFIANTVNHLNAREDMALGGGPSSRGGGYDDFHSYDFHHDDFEMYTDTDGGGE